MEETYFLGGYYLVEGSHRKNWMNASLLPQTLYSLSSCICSHHPDISILDWVNETENRDRYKKKLGLNLEDFQVLQGQVEKWFNQNKYGWGGGFFSLNLAKKFAVNYLSHLQNIRLLAIAPSTVASMGETPTTRCLATTARHRDLFLEEELFLNKSWNTGETGIYQVLQARQTIKLDPGFLGYEILGYEFGGFHSFACNSLEENFKNKLNIKLNQHGLIDRYSQAIKASDYVNHSDTGAEEVLWLPWAIVELDM